MWWAPFPSPAAQGGFPPAHVGFAPGSWGSPQAWRTQMPGKLAFSLLSGREVLSLCPPFNSLSALPQSLQHLLSVRSSASFCSLSIFLALLFSVIHLESIIITPVSHQGHLLSLPVVLQSHGPTPPGPGSFRQPQPPAVPLEGSPILCPESAGACALPPLLSELFSPVTAASRSSSFPCHLEGGLPVSLTAGGTRTQA